MAEPSQRDREMLGKILRDEKHWMVQPFIWRQVLGLLAAAREEGRREERERCLAILDEEGWLGLSKQRMESP